MSKKNRKCWRNEEIQSLAIVENDCHIQGQSNRSVQLCRSPRRSRSSEKLASVTAVQARHEENEPMAFSSHSPLHQLLPSPMYSQNLTVDGIWNMVDGRKKMYPNTGTNDGSSGWQQIIEERQRQHLLHHILLLQRAYYVRNQRHTKKIQCLGLGKCLSL